MNTSLLLHVLRKRNAKYYDVILVSDGRLIDDRTFRSLEKVGEYLEALKSLGLNDLKWHVYFGDGRALVFLRKDGFRW